MKQNITLTGYELFDGDLALIGYAERLIAPHGVDAVGLAKAFAKPCVIVRCADGIPLMAFGIKPAGILQRWRAAMMPGVLRGAA